MAELAKFLIVAVLALALVVYVWRENRRIDRAWAAREAAMKQQHRRETEALYRWTTVTDQFLRGVGSHEQVEAAYDEYVRVCFGEGEGER